MSAGDNHNNNITHSINNNRKNCDVAGKVRRLVSVTECTNKRGTYKRATYTGRYSLSAHFRRLTKAYRSLFLPCDSESTIDRFDVTSNGG